MSRRSPNIDPVRQLSIGKYDTVLALNLNDMIRRYSSVCFPGEVLNATVDIYLSDTIPNPNTSHPFVNRGPRVSADAYGLYIIQRA